MFRSTGRKDGDTTCGGINFAKKDPMVFFTKYCFRETLVGYLLEIALVGDTREGRGNSQLAMATPNQGIVTTSGEYQRRDCHLGLPGGTVRREFYSCDSISLTWAA